MKTNWPPEGTSPWPTIINDGSLDIAFGTATGHALLKNASNANSWLKIVFRGSLSSRQGFGTKLWVEPRSNEFTDRTLYREYWGEIGAYHARGCGPLCIDLGGASSVDLRVVWPSGKETSLTGISVNQTLEIEEPGPTMQS